MKGVSQWRANFTNTDYDCPNMERSLPNLNGVVVKQEFR